MAAALMAAAPLDEAWCARAEQLLADVPTDGAAQAARFDEAAALFEPASPVVARARVVIGSDGDERVAFAVLVAAAAESCAPVAEGDAATTAAALKSAVDGDARFAGVRRGDDLFDRLRHKLFLWLASFLETEGMQRFAGSTRTLFFMGLAIVAALLGVRVALRLQRRRAAGSATPIAIEAARIEAFEALRADAGARLRVGDARGALLAGARALLVRVGEREAHATRAASTHREVLAALAPAVATAVAPALAAFERAVFAGEATHEHATAFLALVDDAAARLGAPPSPGARS
ncbi:MAG: hypothetical protein IT383_22590 [Deltaproteobacteria bacterium]|nr:hypothetical protein [Deltaproteobacteria bacterium]